MLAIDKNSDVPVYKQLYELLKKEAPEHSPENIPLPPVRALAEELKISKNTVERVYQQLVAEGYIYAIPGSGCYWNYLNPNRVAKKTPLYTSTPVQEKHCKYNFCYGNADNKLFPWYTWKRCVKNALNTEEEAEYLVYGDKRGYYPLREVLAAFLKSKRGVKCTPEQILLCSGIQSAISLLLILIPHDCSPVAMEEPGYDGVRNTFLREGCEVIPVQVDEHGMSLWQLAESRSKLAYVTPSHQFPLGRLMPIKNRYELLSIMSARNGFIIEDDYDSEFRYGTMAIPSLQSLDTHDCVIYTGSFSKTFSPTLRFTYMVLPNQLMEAFDRKFNNYKNTIPDFLQIALYNFIDGGYYSTHLRKLVKLNENRFRVMLDMFNSPECPECITPIVTNAGVHMVLRIHTGLPQEEVLALLEKNDVRLYTLRTSWYDQSLVDPELFLLGFASMDIEDLKDGIRRLFEVIRSIQPPSHR